MTSVLDLASAILAAIFRIITSPLLLLLFCLSALIFTFKFVRSINWHMPAKHFNWSRLLLPLQLKRYFHLSRH
jgi:hypothetical protein